MNKTLLCVTQDGVTAFGIQTGQSESVYTGAADQAMMCGQALLVRSGGSVIRVMNGQMATIRRDGASCLLGLRAEGDRADEQGRDDLRCERRKRDDDRDGSFEAASIANGVLYLGSASGYTKSVSL